MARSLRMNRRYTVSVELEIPEVLKIDALKAQSGLECRLNDGGRGYKRRFLAKGEHR